RGVSDVARYDVDALTLGVQLREVEREQREWRIRRAISSGNRGGGSHRQEREWLAAALYGARWDGRPYWEEPDATEILDTLCQNIFGCSFEDVLEAWDRV